MFEPGSSFSEIINRAEVTRLADALGARWSAFDRPGFIAACRFQKADKITARIDTVTAALEQYLPEDFEEAVGLLVGALPRAIDDEELATTSGGFMVVPQTMYVARKGLSRTHFNLSMQALEEMTMRFSAESAIRYFIEAFPAETMKVMQRWAGSKNLHVRRLASEGCRPRLPWAIRLKRFIDDPAAVITVLDRLKLDDVLYVRRSVANNLNDISKDNPAVALDTLERWQEAHPGDKRIQWITGHALRTLLKAGDARALRLNGYDPAARFTVGRLSLSSQVSMGEVLEFSFTVDCDGEEARAMIDYRVDFVKANGSRTAKVFKLAKKKVGQKQLLTGRLSFKPMSTRRLYAGRHTLTIQVNGIDYTSADFTLVD